jgi:pimeloyl-ACP methyl ester carboxylesterase
MPTLDLPDGRLYYEVRGSGPALLLIPTGNGDAGPLVPLAECLADRYTVISYDKRGYSRSTLDEPLAHGKRVDADIEDARLLLERLVGEPAYVFGTCSGGIAALGLLARHPELVRTLVAYEPPIASVLPDAEHWLAFYRDLYALYRREGAKPAMAIFRDTMGLHGETRPPEQFQPPPEQLDEMLTRIRNNHVVWFEDEVLVYPGVELDIPALKSGADRLVLAGGRDSRQHWPYRPNTVLAEQIGLEIVHFPGGHVGHVTHPVEFADRLDEVLRGS